MNENEIYDQRSPNKHSALSGDDNLGDLVGENPAEDRRLREEIVRVLSHHFEFESSGINVAVKDGFVSLTGYVGSDFARSSIMELVGRVDGIRDVVGLLEIDESLNSDIDFGFFNPT